MASQRNVTEVPTQQGLVEVGGDGSVLQPFLRIQPPENASKTPPILAFRRKREVEIPWADIVRTGGDTRAGDESIAAIREYFEESWDLELSEEALNKHPNLLLAPDGYWRVKQVRAEGDQFFRADFDQLDEGGKPKAEALNEGFVIRHASGRVYLLIESPGNTLGEEDFKSFDSYESAWQNKIDGIELVFQSDKAAANHYTDFEEIDLRPVLIQRKYQELAILLKFANKVKENVEGVTNDMIKRITETTLDPDELEQLQRKVLRLEIGEYDVQRRIERLASDAARLGYLLVIEKGPDIQHPDGTKTTLEPGKVYTTYRRTARWVEYVSRAVVAHPAWLFGLPIVKKVKVPRPKEQIVEDYQAVDTSKDILAEKRSEMLKAGLQVYVFEQTPSGLVSTEGVPLQQIMDRCKLDEAFRRLCVVMLPVYEESLAGQRLVAKYAIYKRPLPGVVPTILPRLSIEESLTYRTAWEKTQLGELLNSINLAPDEERKVTIIKRFEQETAVTRTSTSIFDISRAETTDLATEMENQSRQERESSATMQLSTKASAGYGPFGAEASASAGASSSLKDVSQAVSRVARKAAKSVSSQNREEVTSTSTARTTISNTDETIATIRNINQGRSLNLMFYRLYNKYEGGLFLEGLRFDVIPSVEVIAGSGVHESKSYSLKELPRLIDEFKAAKVPFAIENDKEYTNRLLKSIETLLRTEYAADSGDDTEARASATVVRAKAGGAPAEPRAEATSVSVARLSFPPPEAQRIGPQAGLADADSRLLKSSVKARRTKKEAGLDDADSRLADLSDRLRRTFILSDDPIAPQELLVAAPGLYLDAAVGAQPSTEPYSELMRTQEVRMRAAEVAVKESESAYQRAMALRLTQMRTGEDANCLTGVLPAPNQKSLTLSLRIPLVSGDWYLWVDDAENQKVETTDVGRHIIAFSWPQRQDWLKGDDLLSRIALVNRTSGDTIVYPIQGHQNDQS